MTFDKALEEAKATANRTGSSVIVCKLVHNDKREYGVYFTLPTFGVRIGDRIYPDKTENGDGSPRP